MFFVAKEKIGTTLGQQKEYTACTRRGIGFTSDNLGGGRSVWHYFWPTEMLEPSVRAQYAPAAPRASDEDAHFGAQGDAEEHAQEHAHYDSGPTHFIWSQEVARGEVIGEPLITAYSGEGDWMVEARTKYNAEQQRREAAARPH